MNNRWQQFYQPPSSPLARLGLALLGVGILALSFLLGLFFLVIATGLAVIAAIAFTVRRWLGLTKKPRNNDKTIDVEYRVIRRDRDGS